MSSNETIPPEKVDIVYEEDNPVLYEVDGAVAYLTLNRVKYHNSQNSQMLYGRKSLCAGTGSLS